MQSVASALHVRPAGKHGKTCMLRQAREIIYPVASAGKHVSCGKRWKTFIPWQARENMYPAASAGNIPAKQRDKYPVASARKHISRGKQRNKYPVASAGIHVGTHVNPRASQVANSVTVSFLLWLPCRWGGRALRHRTLVTGIILIYFTSKPNEYKTKGNTYTCPVQPDDELTRYLNIRHRDWSVST